MNADTFTKKRMAEKWRQKNDAEDFEQEGTEETETRVSLVKFVK